MGYLIYNRFLVFLPVSRLPIYTRYTVYYTTKNSGFISLIMVDCTVYKIARLHGAILGTSKVIYRVLKKLKYFCDDQKSGGGSSVRRPSKATDNF